MSKFSNSILRAALVFVVFFLTSEIGAEPSQTAGRLLTQYSLTAANDHPERDPRDWRLLGSTNSGRTWVELDAQTNQLFLERFETKSFDVTSRLECNAYRLEILAARNPKEASSIQLADIDLKGDYAGKEQSDLRPQRSDLVLVQGEFPPIETRRMAFDGNLQTKWLDFNPGDRGGRSTWIEWRYDVASDDPDPLQIVSRVVDLHVKARTWARELYRLDLKAVVTWSSGNHVVLSDSSGFALVDVGTTLPEVKPGTTLSITGNVFLDREGATLVFRASPVVDNDGIHSDERKSGTRYLTAGRHPISVEWFQAQGFETLQVEYEGPGIPRQTVPGSVLFRKDVASGDWKQGLDYRYYEGEWTWIPKFRHLTALKEGVTETFTLPPSQRTNNYGVVFSGYFEAPTEGEYTFHTTSDDGSLLFVGATHPRVTVTGTGAAIPPPIRLAPGPPPPRLRFQWVQVEGEVMFVGESVQGWEMALRTRSGPMRVLLGPTVDTLPHYLLHSRVSVSGICLPAVSPDEEPIPGELVAPSLEHIRLRAVSSRHWRRLRVSDLPEKLEGEETVHLRGTLTYDNGVPFLRSGERLVRVFGATPPNREQDFAVEAIGRLSQKDGQFLLALAHCREIGEMRDGKATLPTLGRIEQIHGLSQEEALKQYPVRIRGVVIAAWPDSENGGIHDGTRGIFVPNLATSPGESPEVGDYLEVEGVSDPGHFAPVIITHRVSRLGKGTPPEPVRPTWAQLMNGSMDMQYVELRGAVISVEGEYAWMLLAGGRLKVRLEGMPTAKLQEYRDSVVRVRGCLTATWDSQTRKVVPGEVTLNTVSISVERDAPTDGFDVPTKRAGDLLLFDPRADDLQRVKVRGQVLESKDGVLYLTDDAFGIRCALRSAVELASGDLVEAVGFPRPEGPAVMLREASVRKVGHADLPQPRKLSALDLFRPENDSMRVTLEARLISIRSDRGETILDLEIGPRNVQALVQAGLPENADLPLQSVIEVTGVYAGQGSSEQRRVESFTLLVDSFKDIRIVERPPWWTSQHTAAAAVTTLAVLALAAIWIRALRGQVAHQTAKLQREVDERKQAEEVALRARREAETARAAAEAGSRAKSQFLATMSHEIRTPMNGILGMTNLLLNSDLSREQRELAETVNSSGEALLAIMNDVLDFSKIEAGKMLLDFAEFNLREIVEGTIDLIAERAQRKNLELNYWIDPAVPEVLKGDAGRLRQVLLNLLSNAVKFTEKGEVFLQVSCDSSTKPAGKVPLRFVVSDTGIGIDAQVQRRLFAAFEQADQTTTRKYGGTGLGLAICKRLVELMDGKVGVKSSPGEGATFWFTVVLESGVPSTETHDASAEDGKVLHSARLLIIEEKSRTGGVLKDLARSVGLHAEHVQSIAAANNFLQYAARASSTTPLMVLVGRCDGKDALTVALEIRQHQPGNLDVRIGLFSPIHARPQQRDLERSSLTVCLSAPVRKKQLQVGLLQLLRQVRRSHGAAQTPVAAPVQPDKPARILLAEDNIVNQRVALKQLQRLGYTADVATTGVEVLEAVARSGYDVILMDCQMPELDGYEATRRIRELPNSLGQIRIIAMTANAMHGDREKCLEAGMDDYISKPVKIEDLRAALEGRCPENSPAA